MWSWITKKRTRVTLLFVGRSREDHISGPPGGTNNFSKKTSIILFPNLHQWFKFQSRQNTHFPQPWKKNMWTTKCYLSTFLLFVFECLDDNKTRSCEVQQCEQDMHLSPNLHQSLIKSTVWATKAQSVSLPLLDPDALHFNIKWRVSC